MPDPAQRGPAMPVNCMNCASRTSKPTCEYCGTSTGLSHPPATSDELWAVHLFLKFLLFMVLVLAICKFVGYPILG